MSADFLVELGSEELPPKALMQLSEAFTAGVVSGFASEKLHFGAVQSYAAPRRLAVMIKALDSQAPDSEIVIWGPPTKVAFDAQGQPTRAGEAFANKNNLALDKLTEYIDNDGQQHKLCVRRTQAGSQTRNLLAKVITDSLATLPIPKRMRWGSGKEEFVRPIHWVVLLFDGQVCDERIMGLQTSNISRGHRFHAPGDIKIDSPSSYAQQLESAYVVADFNRRRDMIDRGVKALAADMGGKAVIDQDLLNEVSALSEWPVPLLGRFDEHFLSVPAEALISSMKEHQKYFHLLDSKDQLMAAFITVANIDSKDPAQVIAGNQRVIRPRLADAAFFYNNDRKSTLASRLNLLKQVVFQAQLGSIYDKTQRIAALAAQLAVYTGADVQLVRRAAELSKCDLVTDMVGEFGDLQGIMGRNYALNDGENPEVAEALFEQYLPRFAGDTVPSSAIGTTLALADRLDSLVGIFSIGQQPSGSRDPFALRRASLGVLRIIIERNIDVDLNSAINSAASQFSSGEKEACKQVLTYILDRFKYWYKEQNITSEVFLSVARLGLSNPLDINARVQAVHQFSLLPQASALATANKRVANILAKQLGDKKPTAIQTNLLQHPAEKQLAADITSLSKVIKPLLASRDYHAVLENLAQLHDPVDQFFNQVMVMAEDSAIRENRLALLYNLRELFIHVADISQLAPVK